MKRARLGREPIEIIESIPFSQTIFLIASGKNYAQIISQERKIAPSPAVKQLKQLEKAGFIVSKKEKLLNKTIYSVNWSRIVKAFIDSIEKRENLYGAFLDRYAEQKGVFGYKQEYFQKLNFDILKEKRILKNEYLTTAIKTLFISAYESKMDMNLTISFLFENILNDPEELSHYIGIRSTCRKDIEDELKKNKAGTDYKELIEICLRLQKHPLFFSARYTKSVKDSIEDSQRAFKEVKDMEEREAKERGEK
jgi:hypothetical protein